MHRGPNRCATQSSDPRWIQQKVVLVSRFLVRGLRPVGVRRARTFRHSSTQGLGTKAQAGFLVLVTLTNQSQQHGRSLQSPLQDTNHTVRHQSIPRQERPSGLIRGPNGTDGRPGLNEKTRTDTSFLNLQPQLKVVHASQSGSRLCMHRNPAQGCACIAIRLKVVHASQSGSSFSRHK